MGGIGRCLLKSEAHHLGDLVVADLTRRSRPGLIVEAIAPTLGETSTPLADRIFRRAKLARDFLVLTPIASQKNNPRPSRQPLGRTPTTRQFLQLLTLRRRKLNRNRHSTSCHNQPP